jgi:hypothetical protein
MIRALVQPKRARRDRHLSLAKPSTSPPARRTEATIKNRLEENLSFTGRERQNPAKNPAKMRMKKFLKV